VSGAPRCSEFQRGSSGGPKRFQYLPQIFDETQSEWGALRLALKSIATPAEFVAMRRSTQDAHYTAATVVQAIWTGLEHLGFCGGTVLEPAFGIGAFWGHMPTALRERSKCVSYIQVDSSPSLSTDKLKHLRS
jgi:hypothetical protein